MFCAVFSHNPVLDTAWQGMSVNEQTNSDIRFQFRRLECEFHFSVVLNDGQLKQGK